MRTVAHLSSITLLSASALMGGMAGSATATSDPLGVTAIVSGKPLTVKTVGLTGKETPIVAKVSIAGEPPFTWTAVATVQGYDTFKKVNIAPEAGAPDLVGGDNEITLGTNALFRDAGKQEVTLTVADATGDKTTATVRIRAVGKAQKMRVRGVYTTKKNRKVVWGTAGIENPEANSYRVFFKAKGQRKFKSLGRVAVAVDGRWKIRTAKVGAGTYYVTTNSSYLNKAKSQKRRISERDIRSRTPAPLR